MGEYYATLASFESYLKTFHFASLRSALTVVGDTKVALREIRETTEIICLQPHIQPYYLPLTRIWRVKCFDNTPRNLKQQLRFLSTLWPILQLIAHHIQDKPTVSFYSPSIGLISYKWFLTIYAKFSSVKTYSEEDSIFLEKKIPFLNFPNPSSACIFLTLSPFMILQTRASHLSAHDLRLFSTMHSGLVTKCHLRMYSSIEWFNRLF